MTILWLGSLTGTMSSPPRDSFGRVTAFEARSGDRSLPLPGADDEYILVVESFDC